MPLLSQTFGAAALSLIVQGTPMHADYLRSVDSACVMSARAAKQWNGQGRTVVQQRIGSWCVSGTVDQGQWLAEQWRDLPGGAQGWRIRIPLGGVVHRSGPEANAWGVDVIDPAIESRIRYRQSLQVLDQHHRDSAVLMGTRSALNPPNAMNAWQTSIRQTNPPPLRLSQLDHGAVLLSGRHPDGGSYSVVIERGVTK